LPKNKNMTVAGWFIFGFLAFLVILIIIHKDGKEKY